VKGRPRKASSKVVKLVVKLHMCVSSGEHHRCARSWGEREKKRKEKPAGRHAGALSGQRRRDAQHPGTQCTYFTGIKVQILTQEQEEAEAASAAAAQLQYDLAASKICLDAVCAHHRQRYFVFIFILFNFYYCMSSYY
jgi:hypothetical protein